MATRKRSAAKAKGSKVTAQVRKGARSAKGASTNKTQACLALLSRAGGASLGEMQKATGWQMHSLRGLLSGKIGKMPGVVLTSERQGDAPRRYHVKTA